MGFKLNSFHFQVVPCCRKISKDCLDSCLLPIIFLHLNDECSYYSLCDSFKINQSINREGALKCQKKRFESTFWNAKSREESINQSINQSWGGFEMSEKKVRNHILECQESGGIKQLIDREECCKVRRMKFWERKMWNGSLPLKANFFSGLFSPLKFFLQSPVRVWGKNIFYMNFWIFFVYGKMKGRILSDLGWEAFSSSIRKM